MTPSSGAPLLARILMEPLRGVAPAVPDPAHNDDAVYLGKQRERIRDGGEWRRVYHDEVVCGLCAAEHSIHRAALEQLARVGRRTAPAASTSSLHLSTHSPDGACNSTD